MPVSVTGAPRRQPERFGLPTGFLFLFCFDYASVVARKNPIGCIEAFLRAFPEPGEATFVVKSINAEHHDGDASAVRDAAGDHPHVVVLDENLHPVDKGRLLASCDCYVSLHRSEGFGMGMAEAMSLGKPVIATGYSGNLDYMTQANSFLVDYTLTAIGPGADPYPPGGRWAEPDLEHAAALMREVYDDPGAARRRAQRGQADIRRTHSVETVGERMAQRLDTISSHVAGSTSGWEAPAALVRAEHASAMLGDGAAAASDRRGGGLRRHGRRLALRLMRPYSSHQGGIDRHMVDALRAVGRDVAELGERIVAVEALALRDARDVEHRLRDLLEPELSASVTRINELVRRVDDLQSRATGGDERADDIVHELAELRATLAQHAQALVPEEPVRERAPSSYPTAPAVPWSAEYVAAHAAFVGHALDDAELIEAIGCGRALPGGYGKGFDERVVELPWLAAHRLDGAVLDAGSTLNHLHVLRRLRPLMGDLHIVTLAPEERSFPSLGVSYLYADMRSLPLADGVYDRVVSVSTLEHVGLDVTRYGSNGSPAADPQAASLAAASELRRVLRAGGDALLTVPIGRPEHFGWCRTFSVDELDALIERFDPVDVEVTYFRHDGGWRRAARDAVLDARYRDHVGGGPPRNGVVAAEAVACVRLTVA